MSPLPIVAVLTATGSQGKSVVKALSDSNSYSVRALTRDPKSEKAKALQAFPNVNVVDASDFNAAFKGAHIVFAITLSFPNEDDIVKEAARAAENAGVKLFIYSGLPSIVEESGGEITGAGHFERKADAGRYLKTLKMRTVILHLGSFTDNFLNYHFLKYENDEFILTMHMAGMETNQPMLCVKPDLGPIVLLIIDNYETTPSLFESPVHAASYKIRFGDHIDILKKVTGRPVKPVILDGFEDSDRNAMRKYYDDVGLFKGKIIPDPRLSALGFKPHSFEDYIRDEIIPTFGL